MWQYMPLFPALRRKRQVDLNEFKVSLVVAGRFSVVIKQTTEEAGGQEEGCCCFFKEKGTTPQWAGISKAIG